MDAKEEALCIQGINESHQRFQVCMDTGDMEDLERLITDDIKVMAPEEEPAFGKKAALAVFNNMANGDPNAKLEVLEKNIVLAGDTGIETGQYCIKNVAADGDGEPLVNGSFLGVWERGDDGVYRLAQDIWNISSQA